MRSSTLHRRASYAVLSAGLLAAGLVPLTASAAAAVCPTYADPKGDAAPDPALNGPLQDEGLDILGITHSTAGGVLSSTVKTVKLLKSGSDNSFGDWFELTFTAAGKVGVMRVVRDANVADTTTTRLTVDGATTDVVPVPVYDFKAATVTLNVKLADLDRVFGTALSGKPLTAMSARSLGNYVAIGYTFDRATAPAGTAYVVGTACGGAGGTAAKPAAGPTAGASPASSASPTGKPSSSASPAPSGSAAPSASSSASAGASPTGAPPAPQPTVPVPTAGCFGFEDLKGDARPSGHAPNDPDLDILSVTGRTSPASLSGHLRIDKLATKPSLPAFSGHRFEYQFTVGDKVVLLRANAEGEGSGLVGGVAAPDLKVTAAFDTVSSQVVLSVTRESLEKVLDRELPEGTFLDSQIARSLGRNASPLLSSADTAATEDATRARYTVGDNTCFAPKISVSLPGEVQTTDSALLSISMTTSDGRAAADQIVTARVGSSRAVRARTDKQGNATLVAPVTDAAGSRLLVVRSSGSAGEGELVSQMRVVTERALLFLGATGPGAARTVTATLTDDDEPRRGLAGQRVVFAFAGRTIAVTTDSAGRASTRAPAGTAVEATFTGRRGFLTAAKAGARA